MAQTTHRGRRRRVATPDATTPPKASTSGLSLPQIMAGALAAATAAILGSFLGVIGTIGGAAVGVDHLDGRRRRSTSARSSGPGTR